jgi:arabinose-5-phosphate isomerase
VSIDRLQRAREVLDIEREGLTAVRDRLDDRFVQAIDLLQARSGKIVVIGMGKSGIVGRKAASTLSSTGNPAVFLHPAEGLHGDLGIVGRGDVAIVISNSGASPEIVEIIAALSRLDVPIISVTAVADSPLARSGRVLLDIAVPREACPMGLAPTTSTTVTLALCDAIAVVLLEEAGFTPEDFGHLHPGGALGRRLRRVAEVMHRGAALPLVGEATPMREVLLTMSAGRFGTAGVTNAAGALIGIITDGDLRRALSGDERLLDRRAAEVMTADPRTIEPAALVQTALARMEQHKISALFVVDEAATPVGFVHLHDLLGGGAA